jgi:ApaG protein
MKEKSTIPVLPEAVKSNAFWLQSFPTPTEFQTSFVFPSGNEMTKVVKYLFPEDVHHFLCANLENRLVTTKVLKDISMKAFRTGAFIRTEGGDGHDDMKSKELTRKTDNDDIDNCLECIKVINDQILLSENTSVKETFNIRTVVTAVYDDQRTWITIPGYHSFYYRVTIENNGVDGVQILARHWLFNCPGCAPIEVPRFADGVIGEKPVLNPGESFQYMSMTNLEGAQGTMQGSFLLLNQSTNREFEVDIAVCALNAHVSKK